MPIWFGALNTMVSWQLPPAGRGLSQELLVILKTLASVPVIVTVNVPEDVAPTLLTVKGIGKLVRPSGAPTVVLPLIVSETARPLSTPPSSMLRIELSPRPSEATSWATRSTGASLWTVQAADRHEPVKIAVKTELALDRAHTAVLVMDYQNDIVDIVPEKARGSLLDKASLALKAAREDALRVRLQHRRHATYAHDGSSPSQPRIRHSLVTDSRRRFLSVTGVSVPNLVAPNDAKRLSGRIRTRRKPLVCPTPSPPLSFDLMRKVRRFG